MGRNVLIPFSRAATYPLIVFNGFSDLSTSALFFHPPAVPRNSPLSDVESGLYLRVADRFGVPTRPSRSRLTLVFPLIFSSRSVSRFRPVVVHSLTLSYTPTARYSSTPGHLAPRPPPHFITHAIFLCLRALEPLQYHLMFGLMQAPRSILPTVFGRPRPIFLLRQLLS